MRSNFLLWRRSLFASPSSLSRGCHFLPLFAVLLLLLLLRGDSEETEEFVHGGGGGGGGRASTPVGLLAGHKKEAADQEIGE